MDCTIVVVNYANEDVLPDCLQSIRTTCDPASVETVVVDNSGGLARAGFPQRFPWARFLASPGNVGFARASNLGLQSGRGRHVLLLNPDAVLHPRAVESMVAHLDASPGTAIVGPRLLNPDGSLQFSCRRFPGWLTIFFGRYALLSRCFPGNRATRSYLYQDLGHAHLRSVDWVSGACLMARRAAIDRVGPLDEGYFLFVEDMDWCRRMRDAGLEVAYLPDAQVTHRIGVSRGSVAAYVVLARHRAMLRYVRKHFRPSWPLQALVAAGLALRASAQVALGFFAPAPAKRPVAETEPAVAEICAAWTETGKAG